MSDIIIVNGIELKKSKSYKFVDKLRDKYGIQYPIMDHADFYRKATDGRLVVISHSYGFGIFHDNLERFEEMITDGIIITVGVGVEDSMRYSNETIPIMFIDHPKQLRRKI